MRSSLIYAALLLVLVAASVYAATPKPAAAGNKKPATKATTPANAEDDGADDGPDTLPESCRQPPMGKDDKANKNAKKDAAAAKDSTNEACTLRKPFFEEADQADHFCIVCKQNDTKSKTGEADLIKHLQQVITKQLIKNSDFNDDGSGLHIVIQGVDKPINISKALDDPNNDNDHVLHNLDEVLYLFKNKTIAKIGYKSGEPVGDLVEIECPDCEKQLKEHKPQELTPEQKEEKLTRRRDREQSQSTRHQKPHRQRQPEGDEEEDQQAPEDDTSEDANGENQQDARRRQEYLQRQREHQQREQQQQQYGGQQAYYNDPRQQQAQQRRPASGSGGASSKSVPSACRQEIHFTTEDGICSLHVPESADLCITCKADRADAYQVMQSLDSLAQRLAPNNYQYLSTNAEIILVFDPAPRDNRVFDFGREFAQHEPMVQKLEEAYYFFPNQSVTVQRFDDNGQQRTLEPYRSYDDYLRRYQREHEEQQQGGEDERRRQPEQASSEEDANDYYRRQQEQYRQQQQQQQQYGTPSTDVYGRVYPSAVVATATRAPYYEQQRQQQLEDERRRQQWEQQQQRHQQVQPTPTYTPTIYATADYYATQTTPTTTPAYGRTYAYTDRTSQPAYGTMMVSLVTLQPTSTITITADQNGNVVRPTAYAPYIRPDQRGQKHTMCLVVETTQAAGSPGQYRVTNDRVAQSPAARPVPYAGQPGVYERNTQYRG